MKTFRAMLLLLLTLTVPVSGMASVLATHCKEAQAAVKTSMHEAMDMGEMASMAGMGHHHMHHMEVQKSEKITEGTSVCKCGCLCKAQCSTGGCAATALLPASLHAASRQNVKQMAELAAHHALTAYHLDLLRPPIGKSL